MKVKKLIAKLQKLPQDLDVVVWSDKAEQYVDVDVNKKPDELLATDDGLVDDYPGAEGTKTEAVIIGICD